MTVGGLLGALFEGLDHVGVRWALLRGRDTLGTPGGDVDLLVSADHLASFEDVVFELGGFTLPEFRLDRRRRPAWHRFYALSDRSSGTWTKLDVVTRLVYNRQLQLSSGLEDGCLDRRAQDCDVSVLDPTDAFWTVLLHCLLDKQKITGRRAADLRAVVDEVRSPSPGEDFFRALCPPGSRPDSVLLRVRDGDWPSLTGLGARILEAAGPNARASQRTSASTVSEAARPPARRDERRAPRPAGALRAAAELVYPAAWRRMGLGVVPRALDIVEAGSVDGTVLDLQRRPGRCDVLLLTPQEQQAALEAMFRAEHYVEVAGRWTRLTSVGLERVRVVTPGQLGPAGPSVDQLRRTSLPVASRTHCRRAVGTGPWANGGPTLLS